MIKLEALRVFAAVVDAQGLAGAADKLGRTPGALSMTLRDLDRTLGGRLFETDRKNRLTPLGAFVLEQARRSLDAHDRAATEILRFARGEAGTLRVAAVPSIAGKLLPPVFAALRRRAPDLRIELRDIDSRAVAAAVLGGDADIGLASAPPDQRGLEIGPLLEDPFAVLCRRDSDLDRLGRPLTWEDLRRTPFIANGLCDALEEAQAVVAGSTIHIRNVSSLLAFVEAGWGATLLPSLAAPANAALVAIPLQPPAPSRTSCTLMRSGEALQPATAIFLDALRIEAGRLQQTLRGEGG